MNNYDNSKYVNWYCSRSVFLRSTSPFKLYLSWLRVARPLFRNVVYGALAQSPNRFSITVCQYPYLSSSSAAYTYVQSLNWTLANFRWIVISSGLWYVCVTLVFIISPVFFITTLRSIRHLRSRYAFFLCMMFLLFISFGVFSWLWDYSDYIMLLRSL